MEMIRRYVMAAVGTWALAVAPMLCLAGLLPHDCEPQEDCRMDDPPAAGDERHPGQGCRTGDADDTTSCPHETNCAQDPCKPAVSARGTGDRPGNWPPLKIIFLTLDCRHSAGGWLPARQGRHPSGAPSEGRVSLHISDAPLRI